MHAALPVVALLAAAALAGCSRSNNLLEGRVEATVAGHTVVVTDCYRPSVPPPEPLAAAGRRPAGVRFRPCRDADVVIRGDALEVNGRPYGRLAPADTVVVDHGVVRVEK